MFKDLLQRIGLAGSRPVIKPETNDERPGASVIIEVTDATFADIVLGSPQLTVVDFWAEWCQPCEIISAYMGFLAQEYGEGLLLAAIDVDENPQTPERYTVMGLPTLLFMQNGQEVDRVVGVEAYQTIKARVEQWLSA